MAAETHKATTMPAAQSIAAHRTVQQQNVVQPGTSTPSTALLPESLTALAPSASSLVTHIETRTDLSLLFRLVRVLIRPLRPKLVSFSTTWPAGSPQIPECPSSYYGVKISERRIQLATTSNVPLTQHKEEDGSKDEMQNLWLYDFEAPGHTSVTWKRKTKTVYYFAGGGFQDTPSGEHWKLCARMAKDLSGDDVKIVIVSYPLAPNSPAKDSLPWLRAWLRLELKRAADEGQSVERDEDIILMGDSAGGNIVISLAFWWAEIMAGLKSELHGHDAGTESGKVVELETLKRLKSVIVMSPPCDSRNINEEIKEADKMDPVLTMDVTNGAADAWTMGWTTEDGKDAKSDPVLSPNLQGPEAWAALRESGLTLHGLFGTADVLSPDCKVFMRRCERELIRGDWLIWEGQMHCFPLTVCYGLREGREGFEWLKRRVRES